MRVKKINDFLISGFALSLPFKQRLSQATEKSPTNFGLLPCEGPFPILMDLSFATLQS